MLHLLQHQIRQKVLILLTALLAGVLPGAMARQVSAQSVSQRDLFSSASYPATVKIAAIPASLERQDSSVAQNTRGVDSMFRPLADIDVGPGIFPTSLPDDQSRELNERYSSTNYPGNYQPRIAVWDAPNIRYQPLYFEDVSLERYGYTRGPLVQPVASAAYFGASLFAMPLNMVRQHPGSCTTPLGFCRPGSPAPYTQPRWLIQR
jgi:hypothetical protein